ncbi:MAG TPA: chemotaxis protein CheW [Rectinemataceae bacterium]|nr:chemotaxis protein CheW [Rectinemataceae bacterium]
MSDEEEGVDSGVMLVVFAAGNSLMAYDARSVGEVIRVPAITKAHGAAPYVRGVVNLRGRIITVIDLETRLGLPSSEAVDPRLLVIEEGGGEAVAVYVPALRDVIQASLSEFQPLQADVRGAERDFFLGVVRRDELLVAVLDPTRSLAIA